MVGQSRTSQIVQLALKQLCVDPTAILLGFEVLLLQAVNIN